MQIATHLPQWLGHNPKKISLAIAGSLCLLAAIPMQTLAQEPVWDWNIARETNVLQLSADGAGFWIGSQNALELRDLTSGAIKEVFGKLGSLSDYTITALALDTQGGQWIATNKGLAYLDENGVITVDTLQATPNLLSNNLTALLQDSVAGGAWVGTDKGLVHTSTEFTESYAEKIGSPIRALASDGNGGLWAATDAGITHMDKDFFVESFSSDDGLPENDITDVTADGNGGVWAGTANQGLVHLQADGTIEVFSTADGSFPADQILSVDSDHAGGVWAGTATKGVVFLSAELSPDNYDQTSSKLPSNTVQEVLSDGKGGAWLGMKSGSLALLAADGSTTQILPGSYANIPHNYISAMVADGQGGVWVGTKGGGVAHQDKDGVWEVFNSYESDLPNDQVVALDIDGTGGVWVGTDSSGLAHVSADNSIEAFNKTNTPNFPEDIILAVMNDGNGGVWFATEDNSISHLDAEGFIEVYSATGNPPVKLPAGPFTDLKPEGAESLWIATSEDGFALMTRADAYIEHYTVGTLNGLPSDKINVLLPDMQGGVWIGTNGAGLTYMDKDGYVETYLLRPPRLRPPPRR